MITKDTEVRCVSQHAAESYDFFVTFGELCEMNELDLGEAIIQLSTTSSWSFDAGSNGQSDLITVTAA